MASVGDGSFHGVSKENLAWKVTSEAGPEGEGFTVQMSPGGAAQGEGGRSSCVPGADGATRAGGARAVSKGTAECQGGSRCRAM